MPVVLPETAEVARGALPFGLGRLRLAPDGTFTISAPPAPSIIRFVADEIPVTVDILPYDGEVQCHLHCPIGHVPFSAQSASRRSAVLVVLAAARSLRRCRLGVENGQAIVLRASWSMKGPLPHASLFLEIIHVLKEVRPFLRILAPHL